MSAFCKICQSNQNVLTKITPERVQAKLWLYELSCGHIFNWETGHCFEKEYFVLKTPLSNLFALEG